MDEVIADLNLSESWVWIGGVQALCKEGLPVALSLLVSSDVPYQTTPMNPAPVPSQPRQQVRMRIGSIADPDSVTPAIAFVFGVLDVDIQTIRVGNINCSQVVTGCVFVVRPLDHKERLPTRQRRDER